MYLFFICISSYEYSLVPRPNTAATDELHHHYIRNCGNQGLGMRQSSTTIKYMYTFAFLERCARAGLCEDLLDWADAPDTD
jgi:hypothetical protein